MKYQTNKDKYHNFTYMWNLKNKIKNRNRIVDTQYKMMVTRGKGHWEAGQKEGELKSTNV